MLILGLLPTNICTTHFLWEQRREVEGEGNCIFVHRSSRPYILRVWLWEWRYWSSTIFRECVFVFNTLGVCFRDLHSMQKKKKKKETGNEKVSRKKVRQSSKGLQHQYFFLGGKKSLPCFELILLVLFLFTVATLPVSREKKWKQRFDFLSDGKCVEAFNWQCHALKTAWGNEIKFMKDWRYCR